LLQGKRIAFVVGHGVLQQKYGTEAMDALLNLALMSGSIGGDGRGFYFVAMENNEMGAWDMGSAPDFLPGRQPIQEDGERKRWERAWKVNLSPHEGLGVLRMIEEAEKGNLKALYVMGENPLRALPHPDRIARALANLEFFVVQDILPNETTELADVVLPGAAFSEKEGSFCNLEGRIQSFVNTVNPPGEARPDWEILADLGTRMGSPEPYSSIVKVRDEISRLVPGYSDLAKSPDQFWIEENSSLKLFNSRKEGGLIRFSPLFQMSDEEQDAKNPFVAIVGSLRFHLGGGTRTEQSERIKSFELKGEVEISNDDGRQLGVRNGDSVTIESPFGSIQREIRLEPMARPGIIFIPKAFKQNEVMNLFPLTNSEGADSIGFKEILLKRSISSRARSRGSSPSTLVSLWSRKENM
jgi:predicted molibdopterin-dependent oxidoreductase YjgC